MNKKAFYFLAGISLIAAIESPTLVTKFVNWRVGQIVQEEGAKSGRGESLIEKVTRVDLDDKKGDEILVEGIHYSEAPYMPDLHHGNPHRGNIGGGVYVFSNKWRVWPKLEQEYEDITFKEGFQTPIDQILISDFDGDGIKDVAAIYTPSAIASSENQINEYFCAKVFRYNRSNGLYEVTRSIEVPWGIKMGQNKSYAVKKFIETLNLKKTEEQKIDLFLELLKLTEYELKEFDRE